MELIAPHLIVMDLSWGNCALFKNALVLPYVAIFIHSGNFCLHENAGLGRFETLAGLR